MSLAHLDPETMDDWAPVGDEASWRRCIDAWDGGVGARRRKKVLELARHAASKFASANHKEQLVGLEQVRRERERERDRFPSSLAERSPPALSDPARVGGSSRCSS